MSPPLIWRHLYLPSPNISARKLPNMVTYCTMRMYQDIGHSVSCFVLATAPLNTTCDPIPGAVSSFVFLQGHVDARGGGSGKKKSILKNGQA